MEFLCQQSVDGAVPLYPILTVKGVCHHQQFEVGFRAIWYIVHVAFVNNFEVGRLHPVLDLRFNGFGN